MSFRSTAPTTQRAILLCFPTTCPSGQVRSARRAHILRTPRVEWGGLYVSLGDPELAGAEYPLLADKRRTVPCGERGQGRGLFLPDKTITAVEEHISFFKLRDYVEANYNFSVAPSAGRFTFENGVTYEKSKSFASVGIPFTSSDSERVLFTYDKEKNLLVRSDKNSKNVLGESKSLTPTDDVLGYENEPITVQNLIVQFVRVSAYDSNYRSISVDRRRGLHVFRQRRAVFGSWSRAVAWANPRPISLYDGTPLRLEPGNTWIMMMPSTQRYQGAVHGLTIERNKKRRDALALRRFFIAIRRYSAG